MTNLVRIHHNQNSHLNPIKVVLKLLLIRAPAVVYYISAFFVPSFFAVTDHFFLIMVTHFLEHFLVIIGFLEHQSYELVKVAPLTTVSVFSI